MERRGLGCSLGTVRAEGGKSGINEAASAIVQRHLCGVARVIVRGGIRLGYQQSVQTSTLSHCASFRIGSGVVPPSYFLVYRSLHSHQWGNKFKVAHYPDLPFDPTPPTML